MTTADRQRLFDVLMSGLNPEEYPELACMVADDVQRLEPVIEDIIAEAMARFFVEPVLEEQQRRVAS